MGKKSRQESREARRVPLVHVKIASADMDLGNAGKLIKPAILYADRVTIFSPAASIAAAVRDLGRAKSRADRASAMVNLVENVPSFAAQVGDVTTLRMLQSVLAADPRHLRGGLRGKGYQREVGELFRLIEEFDRVWDDVVPQTIADARTSIGADDLLKAVEAGAVQIAPLGGETSSGLISGAVRAALGEQDEQDDRDVEQLMQGFLGRIVEIVTQQDSFPLLDADASGLVRALESVGGVEPGAMTMRRGVEATASAKLMGFLPYFPELPMDEVLDLRRDLEPPLVRFRAAMSELTREFVNRSIDPDFDMEVEDAWRSRVAPALLNIRESLHEHRLLVEYRSIVLGEPRHLLAEAGGVVAAGHLSGFSLSNAIAAGLAIGVPSLEVLLRSLQRVLESRRVIQRESFYFLHRLGQEALSRASGE